MSFRCLSIMAFLMAGRPASGGFTLLAWMRPQRTTRAMGPLLWERKRHYTARLGGYPRVGEDDHTVVERHAAKHEETAAAVALGQRAVPPDEVVVLPQAERRRLRLAARQEAVGRRVAEYVAMARDLRPRIPLDDAGGIRAEHVGEARVQLAVEVPVAEVAVPPGVPQSPGIRGLDGVERRDASDPAASRDLVQPIDQSQLRAHGGRA